MRASDRVRAPAGPTVVVPQTGSLPEPLLDGFAPFLGGSVANEEVGETERGRRGEEILAMELVEVLDVPALLEESGPERAPRIWSWEVRVEISKSLLESIRAIVFREGDDLGREVEERSGFLPSRAEELGRRSERGS